MKRNKSDKAKIVKEYFNEILPNAMCSLNYFKDYELVIAVMLSAQTTDAAVNKATVNLFNDLNSLEKIASADLNVLKEYIKSIGLCEVKSKNCKGIAEILLKKYNGIVPKNKEDLMSLPGVGNKTANVVLAELFKIPEFPVDTHIHRIAIRLGFAPKNSDVLKVEKNLKKAFPKEEWISCHHQFIIFGRTICNARSPKCEICKLKEICDFYKRESKASK